MLLNDYSVRIVGGNETPGGYVEMRHGQTFTIALRNNNDRRCDAKVEVNGVHVGTWRLNAFSSAALERPADGDGKFTFYRQFTSEAYAVQAQGGEQAAGLVVVTFTPERVVKPQYVATAAFPNFQGQAKDLGESTMSYSTGALRSSHSAGVIGQSGHSYQQYGIAGEIEYDYAGQTTISLRLVCVDDDGPRPLTQRANPVPPPVH